MANNTLDKYREKYKSAQASPAQSSSQGTAGTLDKYREKYDSSGQHETTVTIESRLQQYSDNYRKFIEGSVADSKSIGYANAAELQNSKAQTASALRKEAEELAIYLHGNKRMMSEEEYKSATDFLALSGYDIDKATDVFNQSLRFYSQWDTEEAYNKWNTYNTPEKRQAKYAQNAALLEELKQQKKESTNYQTGRNPYLVGGASDTSLPYAAALQNQGMTSEIDEEIDEEIARIEKEMRLYEYGEADTDGFYYGNKVADDYGKYLQDDAFVAASRNRDYQNADRATLSAYDAEQFRGQQAIAQGGYIGEDGNVYDVYGNLAQSNTEPPVQDKLGMFLSASEEDLTEAYTILNTMGGSYPTTWASIMQEGDTKRWKYLKDDELSIYYGLLNTEGQDAAYRYLDAMEVELGRRELRKSYAAVEEASGWEQVLMNAASVPLNLIGGLAAGVDNIGRLVSGKGLNPYSRAQNLLGTGGYIRANTAEEIDEATGGWAIPGLGYSVGEVYQAGMSMIDSLVGAKVGGKAYRAMMSMGAASSEMAKLYSQGASTEQMVMAGFAAGAAEWIFEKYSIENLISMKSPKTLGQFLKNALMQGGIEASEEMATELANIISNGLIMQSESDWARMLEENGGDYGKALGEMAIEVINSGLSGLLSGAGSGSIQQGMQYGAQQAEFADTGAYITNAGSADALKQLAMEMASGASGSAQRRLTSQSNRLGREFLTEGGKNRAIGRLYNTVRSVMTEQNIAEVSSALQEKGFSKKDAVSIAGALAVQSAGLELTDKQQKTLDKFGGNADVQQVMAEILGNEESGINQRVKSITQFEFGAMRNHIVSQIKQSLPGQENAVASDNVDAQSENGTEGSYEVSAEGKTLDGDGNAVSIKEISSIKDGRMTLKLEDGRTVDAEDVSYASESEALVYETVANMGVPAVVANVMIQDYMLTSNANGTAYSKGLKDAYMYGAKNYPVSELARGTHTSELTETQRLHAYNLGKSFGKENSAEATDVQVQNALESKPKEKPQKTVRRRGRVKGYGITINELNKAFNSTQKKAYRILAVIAEVTGIDIVLYKSTVGKDGNLVGGIVEGIDMSNSQGAFSFHNDKIYIDINAGLIKGVEMGDIAKYSMLRTFSHEFTHFIEKRNPVEYENFRDLVFETMRNNGTDPEILIDMRMERTPDMTREKASREVVAEAMTDILPESSFVQNLAKKHKNIFQKLHEKLKEFAARIKDYFNSVGANSSLEAAAVKETVGEAVRYPEDIVKMFDRIAEQAVEHYQTAATAQKNTATEGGAQHQARPSVKNPMVLDPQTVTKADVVEMLENVKSHKYADNTYIPVRISTPGIVQERLFAENLPVIMPVSKVAQAFSHDSGPTKGKNVRGHSLSVDQIVDIIEKMDSPDFVYSQDNGRGVEVIRLGDASDNTVVIVEFNNNVNPAYMNGYEGGVYNVSVTAFNVDGGNVGLFMYGQEKGWHEVFSKQKEGDPAKKFPATRPFAVEQDSLDDNVSQQSPPVNNNSSGEQHQQRTSTLTNRDILAQSTGSTELERNKIKAYQEKLALSRKQSRILVEANRQISELSTANDPKNKEKIRELKTKAIEAKNCRDILETQLRRMENGVLAPLIEREKGRVLEMLRNEYGTIPKGEKAVRDDGLPVSTDGTNKVSRTTRTVKGAGVTPDDFAELIDTEVAKGGLTYIPITNDETTQRAVEYIKKEGWEAARHKWSADVQAGKTGADLVARGALLLNNAANAGDKTAWLDILHDYQFLGTNTAQGMQAMRILKQLAPEDKLYTVKRSIDQMVRDMKLDITLDEELKKQFEEAETDEERDAILKQIQKSVADQIPSTWLDKWTALRYTNMLGNLRTQVRNVFGNVAMMGTTRFKDLVATGLEQIAYKASGGKFERTKSLTVSKEMLDSARADFKLVESIVQDGGKYSDTRSESTEFAKAVMEQRTIFKNRLLEGYRKKTNELMEEGDLLFSKAAYSRALAGYLKANGITESDFSKVDTELMNKARLYAVQEAQEQTFHDTNVLSGWVAKIGRRRDTPAAAKAVSEGIMPFRKTAANILVRAEEYSPIGILNSVYTSIRVMQRDSDVTGAQVVNSWAKTLTGTGLFALGAFLFSAGILIGGPDDDDDLEDFEALNGQQNYALKIGDLYITIDFLSPAAIPMFMGGQFWKLVQEDGFQAKDIEAALTSVADPLIQMSMLQGVNDTLESIQYAENNLMQMGINAMVSYFTQGLTNSFAGQLERSFENQRMSTYVDKDGILPDWLQRALGKASAKTPGLDYSQIPYINAWGEEEKNPPVWLNMIYNTLSPSYISKGEEDAVSKELTRLNGVQSDINVFPSTPDKTFKYEGEERNLTAEEYVALAKLQGQTQRKIVESMVDSKLYAGLPDVYKAKAIEFAYDYARENAQIEVLDRDGFTSDWMAEIKGDTAEGILKHVIGESIKEMYLSGDIPTDEAVKRRMEYHGDSKEEAKSKVTYWHFQTQHSEYEDWSEYAVAQYNEFAKPANISLDIYGTYLSKSSGLTGDKDENGKTINGSKKAKVMDVIDSLPLTDEQKNALYRANGWAESKINEAPWNQ